jgi:acetyl-CoA acetyltransferase family protein
MPIPVIVGATRTAVGTAFKGSLANTTAEELSTTILQEAVRRSGIDPASVDDVIFAESHYGGGDLARFAATASGMATVPGQAVNRHCAGSLTAVANASALIGCGVERVVVAGGVQSVSTGPSMKWRVPGTSDQFVDRWLPPTHVETEDAPTADMSITVGWNAAKAFSLTREQMDAWALRSHQRAIAAIDSGEFAEEITPLKVLGVGGELVDFSIDEHPRRSSSAEKLASLKPLHPEIDGFSITAGNSSGINDGAAALTVVDGDYAQAEGLTTLATIRTWANVAVEPRFTGLAAAQVIGKLLDRAGLTASDIALWEINEAFAAVPIAACLEHGIDDDRVNVHGSGCSIGHAVAATGARMLTTLVHDLRRRGGGLGVAAMCAGGGQGGAMLIEV